MDVYRTNFYKLSSEVRKIIDERAKLFIDDYIKKAVQNNIPMDEFKNLDYQYIFYKAQEGYIRSGWDDLKDILQQVLLKRAKEPDFSLKQIVLNESVNIVNKLTIAQIDIITILFILNHCVNRAVKDYETLYFYLNKTFIFINNRKLTVVSSNIKHLIFLGCANTNIDGIDLISSLIDTYPGIFSVGFTREKFESFLIDNPEFKGIPIIRCGNNKYKFQINSSDIYTVFSTRYSRQSLDKLVYFQNSYLMTNEEVESLLKKKFINLIF